MKPTVYLAGPIAGCDKSEANDWRKTLICDLDWHGFVGVSPLRCEPVIGERYEANYADPMFGTARAISAKNMFDVRRCDMTLAYLPKALTGRRPSYGTICELAWARFIDKPTILVTDDESLSGHPLVGACSSWVLDSLEDATAVIVGVLGVYR